MGMADKLTKGDVKETSSCVVDGVSGALRDSDGVHRCGAGPAVQHACSAGPHRAGR